MNLNENRATGFTLIEIMVVISVFGLILTAVMMLFLQGTKTYRQSVTMAQMRFRTQKAIDDMKSELVDARLIDSNNRLDTISFQRPTPVEDALGADPRYVQSKAEGYAPILGNGDLHRLNTTDDNIATAGASHPRIIYRFVKLVDITEAGIGFDLNNDNDMNDTFERGRIERVVTTSLWVGRPETLRRLTDD